MRTTNIDKSNHKALQAIPIALHACSISLPIVDCTVWLCARRHMAYHHQRAAMAAGWAVLIFLMSANPTQARYPRTMITDTNWLAPRDMLLNQGRLLTAQPQAAPQPKTGSSCPDGYRSIHRGTTTAPTSPAVLFSDLHTLGWSVTSRASSTDPPGTYTNLEDFYSVMCESFDNVGTNGTTCLKNNGDAGGVVHGIAHARYDCSDKSMWILTYVVADDGFDTNTTNMWIDTDCNDSGGNTCHGPDASKTFKYSGTAASGDCEEMCTTAPGSGICCYDMWPVIDTTGRWIGYLAKGIFALPSPDTSAWDTMLLHFDWAEDPIATSGGNTGSNSATRPGSGGNGICLTCDAGEPSPSPSPSPSPPEEPLCTPTPTVAVAPLTGVSYCNGSTSVQFNFTVTPSDLAHPNTYKLQSTYPGCSGVELPGVYQVTCTGDPLPADGVSVTLTVTPDNTQGLCSVPKSASATEIVAVRHPPTITPPAIPTINKCSSEGSFTVAFDTTITPSPIQGTILVTPDYCTIKGQANPVTGEITTGTYTVECTKPEVVGWPGSFPLGVSFTAGDDDCSTDTDASADVTIITKPEVTIEGLASTQVCTDKDSVSLSYTASSGDSGAQLSISATPTGANMVCTTPTILVNSGSSVTVDCGPLAGSPWPEGTFTVTVSATAATSLAGCSDTNDMTTSVQVNKKPTLTIEQQSDVSVCSNQDTLTLQYNINSGSSGLPFDINTDQTCKVQGGKSDNVGSPSTITLVCTDQFKTNFKVHLAATAGVTGCADTEDSYVDVTLNLFPDVSLTGDASKSVCANSGSTTLTFTAKAQAGGSGVPWNLVFTTDNPAVSCDGKSGTGQVSVDTVCSTSGGPLPESFTVTGTLTSGAPGCVNTATFPTSVTASCCIKGSSYARGQLDSSSFSTATCFSTGLSACGNSNWGWSNQLSGDGGPTPYPIIVGGGLDCKGRTTVGQISISCATVAGVSTVALGPLDQTIIGTGISNHMYLGCKLNTACTPPSYYAPPKNSKTKLGVCGASSAAVDMCGGNVASLPVTATLGCGCGNVYWVFHQSYDFFTTPHLSGGGCPSQ